MSLVKLDFKTFLENITASEISKVTKDVKDIISQSPHMELVNVVIARDPLSDPSMYKKRSNQLTTVSTVHPETGEEVGKESSLWANHSLARNLHNIFGKRLDDLDYTEILKFDIHNQASYKKFEWIIVMLGFKGNEKDAYITFSPNFSGFDVIKTIGNTLKKHNYRLFVTHDNKELHSSPNFINELVNIFRNISGRFFGSVPPSKMIMDYKELIKKYPKEYAEFKKRKKEVLGNGVSAFRLIGVSNNYPITKQDGTIVPANELKEGDKAYYTPTRMIDQWAEGKEGESETISRDILTGARPGGSLAILFFAPLIPTDQIIFTNKILIGGFSPNIYEREVIVYHPNKESSIPCEIKMAVPSHTLQITAKG